VHRLVRAPAYVLCCVCVRVCRPQAERFKVVRHVERYARDKGSPEVTMAAVFDAKPDSAQMFPNPVDNKFVPHVGAVCSLDTSPHHRNLFVSCGADGRVNLFSVLQVCGGAPAPHLCVPSSARW
jgi:hypothetical protein